MSRPVLGGLVGRSAEWVKTVENDRLLTSRIPLLLRLVEVLKTNNLGLLTGEQKLASAAFTKEPHEHYLPWWRRLEHTRSLPVAQLQ